MVAIEKTASKKLSTRRRGGTRKVNASAVQSMALAGAGFITHFIDKRGIVDVDLVADTFRMTKGQLAETVGIGAAAIGKAERRTAPRTQSRVREMLEIVFREFANGQAEKLRQWPGTDHNPSQPLMAARLKLS